jgi:acyl-CoA thioesterase FadM
MIPQLNSVQSWNRVDKYYEAEMTVQDCDLDKYGVVNNAIYASYIEKG